MKLAVAVFGVLLLAVARADDGIALPLTRMLVWNNFVLLRCFDAVFPHER